MKMSLYKMHKSVLIVWVKTEEEAQKYQQGILLNTRFIFASNTSFS